MRILLRRSAVAVIASALAAAIMPPAHVDAVEYARTRVVVPDGPKAGDLWDDSLTPYVAEPLLLSMTDSGVNEIAIRKSAQTGFTTLLLASTAYYIMHDACRIMIVQPTISALSEFNKEKLSVMLAGSPDMKRLVRDQTSRRGEGSTAVSKRFPGGSIKLAIANSARDLRSSTIRKAWCDEVDEYPWDLDGQGDPIGMVEARQESFLMSGDWFRGYVSTPTIKGASRIDGLFEAGDQRYWNMPCPGCGDMFRFVFDRTYFKFKDAFPHDPFYATPCCGTTIEAHEKVALMKKGRWIAEKSRPGAYPSYHFDALSSPFVPWEKIAERFTACNGDPQKLKTFWNLTLGLAYDMKGDAPDHVRLMERSSGEDFKRGHIPTEGLILIGSADVQMNGIWYLIKAIGPDRRSYRVDAGHIEGATDDPHAGAFAKLEEIRQKQWPDAFGRARAVDLFGIDSGYRTHVVYTWCRGKTGVMALKGEDGWTRPALGQPKPVDIDFNGKRIRNGCNVWAVGTWSLKGVFYANLRKEGIAAGQPVNPPGYCHFGKWLDEVYFRHITAEYVSDVKHKRTGRISKEWVPRQGEENHLLDCEVYGDALADYLGVNRMTVEEWQHLALLRGVPHEIVSPDMFAPVPILAAAAAPAPSEDMKHSEPEDDDEYRNPKPGTGTKSSRSDDEDWG